MQDKSRLLTCLLVICVSIFIFTACHGFNLTVTWKKVSGSDLNGYILYESTTGVKYERCMALPACSTTVTVYNVPLSTKRYYYLTSYDKSGNESKPSNVVLVKARK